MQAGELNMMGVALEAGRLAKGRREQREVSEAEFLADVVNNQLMSGKGDGKEFGRLMDIKHK